jgi:elongation factor Ts
MEVMIMAVTAAMVKELRELTGSGMSDCKNALVETDGDIKKAIDYLREKGLAAAAKKAGRIAAEGVVEVLIADDRSKGVVVEVNSETDFVANNAEFRGYVAFVAKQALDSNAKNMDEFFEERWAADPSVNVKEALSQKIAIIGENLNIRRFDKIVKGENGVFSFYIHANGKMGVLLELESAIDNEVVQEAGKNVCMQIAAMYPKYVSRDEIPADFIEKEKEILTAQANNENTGKPAAVIEKMVTGRLNKSLKEYCLLEQAYVKDNDITVGQYLENIGKEVGATVKARKFVCFEKGEGIEKKEENFAEEVSKAMKG